MPTNVLLVTKGHAFDYNGFYAMFNENPELAVTQVEQPAAQVILRPENVGAYDAIVFYDMIGVFPNPDGSFPKPPADYERSMEALVTAGKGMVFMNHAMVEWPGWPLWREITGTSFMLRAGEVFGDQVPGSGYRGGAGQPDRNAKHFLRPATPGHPVLEGLGDGFEVVDELYLISPNFEKNPDIVPLLRSDFEYVQTNFSPPPLAPRDEQAAWSHPKGSDLNVWAKRSRNSPVVVISGGDGPPAYSSPAFRKLLYNSIKWVASAEARAWAEGRHQP